MNRIIGIDHIAITVGDLEAAFRFYVAVLGVGIFIALQDRDLPRRSSGAGQR